MELQVLERFKGDIEEGVIFLRGPTPFSARVVKDPVTGRTTIMGLTTCDGSNLGVFALGSEYVVSAIRNRPGRPFFLDTAEARWVTDFCMAAESVTTEIGRNYLSAFRKLTKKAPQ